MEIQALFVAFRRLVPFLLGGVPLVRRGFLLTSRPSVHGNRTRLRERTEELERCDGAEAGPVIAIMGPVDLRQKENVTPF
jgi:hypothetical protein